MMSSQLKKVVITGPESVGKTVLTEKLARHFQTVWVPEYAREYCAIHGNENLTPQDFAHIAGGQLLLEDEMAVQANDLLICDTDLMTTEIWAYYFLDKCPQWIQDVNRVRLYDLFLVLKPDVPWVGDEMRRYADSRDEFFELLVKLIQRNGFPYRVISGKYEKRFNKAVSLIEQLMEGKLF